MRKFVFFVSSLVFFSVALAQYGSWNFVKSSDSITDKDKSYIINTSGTGIYDNKSIILRCDGLKNREIYVNFDEFLDNEEIPVVYRFDKAKPVLAKWTNSTDGTAAFMPEKLIKASVKASKSSKTLTLRATDFRGTSYTVQFQLSGISSALQKLACFKGY